MNEKLTIAACNFLIPEISQVIKNGDYPEVQLASFPANCTINAINSLAISDILSKSAHDSDLAVIGSFCHSPQKSEIRDHKRISVVQLEQCFELLINPETIYHYIKQGYYIVTNGWLRTLKSNIQAWGFEEGHARTFFRESMKSILLLDTKIPGDYMSNLLTLSDYMKLPYEILPVGLSHCEKYIDSLVLGWKNENEQERLNNKLATVNKHNADHNLIFNQLETLVRLTKEKEITQIAVNLINTLFAPSTIVYTTVDKGCKESFSFKGFSNSNNINNENSFKIEIKYTDELLGTAEVKGLRFPKFKKKYKEMGIVIGQIFGMAIANARKYSELENTNRELKDRESELSKLNATKDKLFSIIAHDLKAPFNSITGFSQLLLMQIGKKNFYKVKRYADIIQQASQRAVSLLTNLMDWSRSQTNRIEFKPEQFDLTAHIQNTTQIYDDVAGQKEIAIKRELPPTVPVLADKDMVSTLLRNLISNAIKFTKPSGEIRIKVKVKNDECIVSIKDNGVGIPKKDIDKIFRIDESYTTEGTANEKGTGLGLILCKEFIARHDKEIWVKSEVGKGTIFYFTLPYVP